MRPVGLASLFVAGLAALLYAGTAALDGVTTRDPQSKVKWIAAKRNRTFGYAVLGSSRAQLTTDVAALDRHWDTVGINLGVNGTATPELDLIWDAFLSSNQVECLLLEVDVSGLDSSTFIYPFHYYEYLPFVRDSIVFRHLAAERRYRAYLWKYLPFAGYAQFNDRAMIAAAQVIRGSPAPWDSTGTMLIDRHFDFTNLSTWKISRFHVDSGRSARLDSIINRSLRRNMGVVMYMAPEYFEVDRFEPNRQELVSYYRSKGHEYGIPFLDAESSELRRDPANFFDPSHLNRDGATKFTKALARSIDSLPRPCVDRRGARVRSGSD